MAMTPEGRVKKRITDLLKSYGRDVYYFMPATGGYGKSGVPDIVACVHGTFVGIEVKADKRKNPPTALQNKNLSEIESALGVALVIDTNDLDFLQGFLDGIIASHNDRDEIMEAVHTKYGK